MPDVYASSRKAIHNGAPVRAPIVVSAPVIRGANPYRPFPEHLYSRPKSAAACFLCSATWRVWPERRYRDHVEIRAVSKLEARAIGADLLGLPPGSVRVQLVRERLASKGVC